MEKEPNPLVVLDKLASNPYGIELLSSFANFWRESLPKVEIVGKQEPSSWLVRQAIALTHELGMSYPPYFKGMTDEEIQSWIVQHSPQFTKNEL